MAKDLEELLAPALRNQRPSIRVLLPFRAGHVSVPRPSIFTDPGKGHFYAMEAAAANVLLSLKS